MIKRLILSIVFILPILFIADDVRAFSGKYAAAEKSYLQGDYKGAAYLCERLFREYKTDKQKSEAAYLAGLCYLRLNDFSKAKEYFEFVLDNSGDSLLINEARIGLANMSKRPPSVEGPSLFSVQVGSFKNKGNAERLYNRFRKRKYTVRMVKEDRGKAVIYKIKIGKFKSKDSAAEFARKLGRSGYQTAVVAY